MNPNSFEEELSSGLSCDTLLLGCHNNHHREVIKDQEYTVITILGWRYSWHVIHGYEFPRLIRINRSREVQHLLFNGRLGNDIGSEWLDILVDMLLELHPIKGLLRYCYFPLYANKNWHPNIMSSVSHVHLKEHWDGTYGIKFHPRDEIQ